MNMRVSSWKLIAICGLIQFCIYGYGSAMEIMVTSAICFHILFAFFMSIVIVFPILVNKRFGTGMAVFLPFAVVGFFVEYYMQWIYQRNLIAPWAAIIWSLFGLLTGLSADIIYHFSPRSWSDRRKAVLIGFGVGIIDYSLTLIILGTLYVHSGVTHLLNGALLTIPYLLVNSTLGGYTAHALMKDFTSKKQH
jgi:hypothetical protein